MNPDESDAAPISIPPTLEELQAGLPHYQIIEQTGRTELATVYQAHHHDQNRNVAIEIWDTDSGGEAIIERLNLTAQSMTGLNHPAIESVCEFGQLPNGQFYMVKELINGMSMLTYLQQQGGKLLPDAAITVTCHILDALQFAHEQGVIHHSVQPANIKINQNGQVKISDFGLAATLSPVSAEYAAPEANAIGSVPDARVDIYATGVLLFQMLTGRFPQGIDGPLSQVLPDLDPRLAPILAKALQPNLENRYRSAREFQADLIQLLSPVTMPAPTGQSKQVAASPNPPLPPKPSVHIPTSRRKKSRAPLFVFVLLLIGLGIFSQSDYAKKLATQYNVLKPKTPVLPSTTPPAKPEINTPSVATQPSSSIDLASMPGFQARLDAYLNSHRERVTELTNEYQNALDSHAANNSGDVNLALVFEDEKAHVANLLSTINSQARAPFAELFHTTALPGLPADTAESVVTLRNTWESEYLKIRDHLDYELGASLQELATQLTNEQKPDHAEAVTTYRQALGLTGDSPPSTGEYVSTIFGTFPAAPTTTAQSAATAFNMEPELPSSPNTAPPAETIGTKSSLKFPLENTVWSGKTPYVGKQNTVTLRFEENQVLWSGSEDVYRNYRKSPNGYVITAPKRSLIVKIVDDNSIKIQVGPKCRPSLFTRTDGSSIPTNSILPIGTTSGAEGRTFTSSDGQTMVAKILFVQGDNVILIKSGKNVTVPISRFTDKDQTFIKNWQRKNAGKPPAHLKDKMPRMTMVVTTGKTNKDDNKESGYIDEHKQKVRMKVVLENNDALYPIRNVTLTVMVIATSPVTRNNEIVSKEVFKKINLPLHEEKTVEGKAFELWYDDRGAMYGHKWKGYIVTLQDSQGKILSERTIPGSAEKYLKEALRLKAGDVFDNNYQKTATVSLKMSVK